MKSYYINSERSTLKKYHPSHKKNLEQFYKSETLKYQSHIQKIEIAKILIKCIIFHFSFL